MKTPSFIWYKFFIINIVLKLVIYVYIAYNQIKTENIKEMLQLVYLFPYVWFIQMPHSKWKFWINHIWMASYVSSSEMRHYKTNTISHMQFGILNRQGFWYILQLFRTVHILFSKLHVCECKLILDRFSLSKFNENPF